MAPTKLIGKKFTNLKLFWRTGIEVLQAVSSPFTSSFPPLSTLFFIAEAMARKRKNRTHLKGGPASGAESSNAPKSFVIKHGQVGTSLTQLVRDVRKVMEPNTASRLKVGIFSFLVSIAITVAVIVALR